MTSCCNLQLLFLHAGLLFKDCLGGTRNIKARHKIPEFLNTHIWHIMIGVESWEPRTWNWGQIFNIKLWMVGQYFSSSRSSYGRLVSNTLDDCLQRQIGQKIVKLKFEACPLHGFQTSNGICCQFGCKLWLLSIHNYTVVSKLLGSPIWSSCAVQFKFEKNPFPPTGWQIRSVALHRI